MEASFENGNVRSRCPDCNAITTFEFNHGGAEFGAIIVDTDSWRNNGEQERIIYKLLRCAGCSRAGVAKVLCGNQYVKGHMEWFWPRGTVLLKLPAGAPEGILQEYQEAQVCMATAAWRAAAALLRSTLEKTLLANGYTESNLFKKIEAAAADGVITSARRRKAQELVRTLGNDVLHEEWRKVEQAEAELAQHYVGRVVEDFYDDRASVEKILREKNRLPTG